MRRSAFVGLAAALALAAVSGCAGSQGEKTRPAFSVAAVVVGICLIPESDYFAEFLAWPTCHHREQEFAEVTSRIMADWATKRGWVQGLLTPELVRSLSRWDRGEMQRYASVPSLASVEFRPISWNEEDRMLLLEGTVDTLPGNPPQLTRWLKLYLLCNCGDENVETPSVVRVIITIEGLLAE